MDILSQLNDSQRRAVEYNDGPSLVIAGAGSGKTRVLTYKIAYLIEQGMAPWNILALTFTNKAANEMKTRIAKLVGDDKAHSIQMGTFHSVFARILRQEAEAIGYKSQFTIYDETDSRSLIKTIVKEMELDDKIYKPASVHARISMAKNHCMTADDYTRDRELYERDNDSKMPAVGKIFVQYEHRCRVSNAMDFDDLLMITYRLFRENETIRQKWANRFRFILVDEYQDTNRVQQKIVELLAKENQKVCVVGDDAQSIYAFRGAEIDNILDFNRTYPNSKLFKLEQNYRSTQIIVQAANSLISHNQRQIRKNVFSENAEGEKLVLRNAYSDKEEAAIVCKDIKKLCINESLDYDDFAILYRTNAQSRSFEEECRKQGIPYKIYGGLSFYQRKEIKDIIAYYRLVVNPSDEEAFKRIINYPTRGIGPTTINKIAEVAQQFGVSYWEVCLDPQYYGLKLGGAAASNIKTFVALILGFAEKVETSDAYELGKEIYLQSGMHKDLFSSKDPEYISRQENMEEFMAALQDFVEEKHETGEEEATLDGFLQEVALQTDKESEDGNAHKIAMMTVHAAKGLEFPVVFIVGMEENVFPSMLSMQSAREMEEERRLFYVAITRAEKHCILTCAKSRWRYGRMENFMPSRFLRDIDPQYLRVSVGNEASFERQTQKPMRQRPSFMHTQPVVPQRPTIPTNLKPIQRTAVAQTTAVSSAPSQSHNLSVGTVIEHQRFGIGTVISVEGTGENTKATVEFRNTGTKQLLLKFAKFTVMKG